MRSRPTIKDVAARAQVSRQTVSRVINNKGEVSSQTKTRVLEAIDELGYRPNAAARSMVRGHTCTLGCISPSLIDYTFANLIEGAQAQARKQGYFLLAGSAPTPADVGPLLEEMLHRQVDGLIVLNPHDDERYRCFLPLAAQGTAIVYLNNTAQHAPISSVRCDDHDGGYQATRYLLSLGHRAIAIITGRQNEECTVDRLQGYAAALEEARIPLEHQLTVRGDWSATSGYRATMQLLSTQVPFTAIFAQNDQMAVGAIRALREAGRSVPVDVSVIGFDDIPLASYFDPPLTTLRIPMIESGKRAAQALIDTIKNPERTPEHISLKAVLVERASCTACRV